MPYYVYILRSLKDGKLYTGFTSNIVERLKRHNQGRVKSTKSRCPFALVYLEEFENRSLAMKREYFLKSAEGGRSKPELIANFDKALLDKYQINYDL